VFSRYVNYDGKPFYAERGWLIGDGQIGGKAKGIAFAQSAVAEAGLSEEVNFPHATFVITTEVFDEFMRRNALEPIVRGTEDFSRVEKAFEEALLPESVRSALAGILQRIDSPVAVRSSSILEDDIALAFAGKYETRFFGNRGNLEYRLRRLERAVKLVYASTFNPTAKAYRRKHGIKLAGEKMAVIIQPVVGRRRGDLYYPELAGAAFSKVFRRPTPRVRKEDGVLRLCFGLGTRVVGRAFARTFFLSHPGIRPEGNSTADVLSHAQDEFDYVDLEHGFLLGMDANKAISHIMKHHKNAASFLELAYDDSFHWILSEVRHLAYAKAVFTFSDFHRRFPRFFDQLRKVLLLFEETMGLPVDIELTYETEGDQMNIVQLRPLATYEEFGRVEIPRGIPRERILLKGSGMVSNGVLERVSHIVCVDPSAYLRSDPHLVARAVGAANEALKGGYILVGPGRWGSVNPALGVPVRYGEISNCNCLVEVGFSNSGMAPELSYGTHFFLDLDADGVLYLPVLEGKEANVYNREWFSGTSYEEGQHPAVRIYRGNFSVLLDGENDVGVVIVNEP